MLGSCRRDGITNVDVHTYTTDFFSTSTTLQRLKNTLDWPQNKPIKILFDDIYGDTRPGFLEGYKLLKENINPW